MSVEQEHTAIKSRIEDWLEAEGISFIDVPDLKLVLSHSDEPQERANSSARIKSETRSLGCARSSLAHCGST